MASFIELVPDVNDLLALQVEDLAEIVLRIMPSLFQNHEMVGRGEIASSAFDRYGLGRGYPQDNRRPVTLAIAEAVSWLESQGLIVGDPDQQFGGWVRLSRRGQKALAEGGVNAYRYGRTLPQELLHPELVQKVRPIYLRGDYDVAVFQAFKVVEIHVRAGANALGAGYPDNAVGVDLMRQAFKPERGPLADKTVVIAEQEATAALFSGAIGHAKNPAGHRETETSPMEAARLIIFASYLLDVVFERLIAGRAEMN